jgi:molybdate transport system substrate-binding protein
VTVFAAASLREAMTEAGTEFTRRTGSPVAYNFAGSNDLAHQIAAAPRGDVFLSASERWMDEVERAGRVVPGSRRDLLSNVLVVVAHREAEIAVAEPCALVAAPFAHLAMGDPDAVPAGTYARDWMRSVPCGGATLWDGVRERVAPAPDVRAALGLVLADPKVIGMVYRTDQRAYADRTKVLHEVRGGPPIRYVVARVAGGPAPAEGEALAAFLAGPEAAAIFARHGFTPAAAAP